jgi:tRNA (guanine-N7-)-methyltransferase
MKQSEHQPNFYGRRKGKPLSPYRQNLFQTLLPRLQPLNWSDFLSSFPEKVVLEIGFGKGEHMLYQAKMYPQALFIGSEPFISAVGTVLSRIDKEKISNVFLWTEDVHLLFKQLPLEIFDEVFILFPDPWPKKRHEKRRLLQHHFLDILLPYLKKDALLNIATDHEAYAVHIEEIMKEHPHFYSLEEFPTYNRPADLTQPLTTYEKKALQAQLKPLYFKYRFQ